MKKILIAMMLVVLLAVVGAWLLYSSLDSILKSTIERVGSEVTGTEVRLAEVELSLTDGRGSLRGLRVANPQGFEREAALRFDAIEFRVDMSTVGSELVVVEEVVIDRPRIRLELARAESNIRRIRKHAEEQVARAPDGPLLIINDLYLRDGSINVAGSGLLKDGLTRPLPDIHIREIGNEQGGASPAAVARRVIRALERKSGGDKGEKLFDLLDAVID